MRGGELLRAHPPLADVRRHCLAEIAALRVGLRRLRYQGEYPMRISAALRARLEAAVAQVERLSP
jgi:DUF971 family protein